MRSKSVRGRTTLLVAYPILLLRHLTALTAIVLENPTLLHASRGLMEYGSWEQTLFDIPSGHCWSEGFLVMVEPCVCSAVSLAQKYGRRAAPLQVTCFSFCKLGISHAALLHFFDVVTMNHCDSFNPFHFLADRGESGGVVASFPSHFTIPGKLTICSNCCPY